MKSIIRFSLCALISLASLSCVQEAEPVKYSLPEVNFTMGTDVINANVGEKVEFKAELVSGEKVSIAWYIDDQIVSSAQKFDYVFSAPGNYTVRFEAVNGGGKVEHTYTAVISDVLQIALSIGDSLVVNRVQLDKINVAAIVTTGANVSHLWTVDGEESGREAYLGTLLSEAREYVVSYHGENAVGSFDRTFKVNVLERPLEISFDVIDRTISTKKNVPVTITATPLYGATGLVHSWYVGSELVSNDATFEWSSPEAGNFSVKYVGVNAKGETVTREWNISVVSVGFIIDDFETGDALKPWWTLKQNTPGIELVDNPDRSGINKSAKCMKDSVTGTGGTSGYFDLKGAAITSAGIVDITQFNTIKIKVWLGQNKYYPRIQVNGTKYAPVNPPKFNGGWEELEFRFPVNFTAEQLITFRPLLKEDGNNIASGAVTDTNTRTVYIDDIEFLN